MAAISQKLVGLVGGVSQQPDSLMLPGQLRECDNFYPDPTFGLVKRPGTQFVRRIENSASTGSWFFICKGLEEKLLLQVTPLGVVKLWDAQSGIEQTVNALSSTATTYASHTKKDDLEVLQINDYVFVLNRTVTVEDDTATAAAQDPFGYVTLQTIAYDTSYTITIDGTGFTYNTPTSSGSSLNAATIVNGLASSINGNANYTATVVANYIHIKRTDGADFSLEATGSLSGSGLKAYKGIVGGIEDLPDQFLNNAVVGVTGSNDTEADNYYLKFETSDNGTKGAGVWVETLKPGTSLGLDPTTMPHAIIREADGTYSFRELSETAANAFTTSTTVNGIAVTASVTSTGYARWNVGQYFHAYGGSGKNIRLEVTGVDANKSITSVSVTRGGQDYTLNDVVTNNQGDTFTITSIGSAPISGSTWATQYWEQRTVGDPQSAPNPSFVGEKITGISFFKNRLILMSQENVVCSQAGHFLRFYPSTVITVVDNDPIDISAGAVTRMEFRHALQQSTGLMMFADNSQYILQTRTEAFSPATAELNLISSFSHTTEIMPLDLGSSFVTIEENDKSLAVNEITLAGDRPLRKDISKLIPSYIPNGIDLITNSLSASLFGIKSIQEPESLYLFRYYTQDNERLLASWFKWTFPSEVLLVEFHEDEIFIVLEGDDNPILCHSELLTETPGGAIEFEGHYMDLRLDVFDYHPSMSYISADDETRIYLRQGANIANATFALVKLSSDDSSYVTYPTVVHDSGGAAGQQYYVTVEGDQTDEQYATGYRYISEARFPGFYVKQDKQADELNIPTVHRARFYSHESGPFKAVLNVPGRNEFSLTFPQISANSTPTNKPPMIRNAENIVPIMAKGRDADLKIVCDSPFPLALITMIWEGTYNNKGIKAV